MSRCEEWCGHPAEYCDCKKANQIARVATDFYIFAGNAQQACDYCEAKDMGYNPRRVLHAPHCLQGLRGGIVLLVGTYRDRKDFLEMSNMIEDREFTKVHV